MPGAASGARGSHDGAVDHVAVWRRPRRSAAGPEARGLVGPCADAIVPDDDRGRGGLAWRVPEGAAVAPAASALLRGRGLRWSRLRRAASGCAISPCAATAVAPLGRGRAGGCARRGDRRAPVSCRGGGTGLLGGPGGRRSQCEEERAGEERLASHRGPPVNAYQRSKRIGPAATLTAGGSWPRAAGTPERILAICGLGENSGATGPSGRPWRRYADGKRPITSRGGGNPSSPSTT